MSSKPEVDVSVLMPVHAAVAPEHVADALDSIASQTVAPRQVVVVVDGPVSHGHHQVLQARRSWLDRVDIDINQGAGRALAVGMKLCTSTWIARADSDDISVPDRLRVQLERLEETEADVCSAPLAEFKGSPANVIGVRATPQEHSAYATLMQTRNPVNQPAVVFRRSLAVDAGGYQHLLYHEDYDLWARMLRHGARFTGCVEPLVFFRADGVRGRRTRPEAIAAEREQQRRLREYGLIGPWRARTNLVVRTTYLRLPPSLMDLAYRHLFRVKAARVVR